MVRATILYVHRVYRAEINGGNGNRVSAHAEAITAFVHGHQARLTRFGYLLTGDVASAEDLVQTALLETIRRWERISRQDNVEAYVRQAMVNRQHSLWRRRSSSEQLRPDLPEASVADPSGRVDDLDLLRRALLQLPNRQRAAVVLRFYEDLTEAQAAQVLGCSVGNVKSQTSRGLAKLRSLLESRPKGETSDALR
jgi:RNA polymerase sigma-70 factor (sigma-E family)